MDDVKSPARPPRKRWRLRLAFAAIVVLIVAGVAAIPWLASTRPGRALLMGRINARLAPGSADLAGLKLGWTGAIELSGPALRDPRGKVVLAARRLTIDRGILELLASRPDYGTVTIEGATVDVERRPDGSVDLLDAVASVWKPDPTATAPAANPAPGGRPAAPASKLAVLVVVKGGTARVASPELVEPFVASTLDAAASISPGKPTAVKLTLGGEGRSLEVRSTIDPAPSGDGSLGVVAASWPIHIVAGGVEAKGRVEGALDATQARGLWAVKGDAAIVGVEAGGPALMGDRPAIGRVAASCDLGQSSTGWIVRKLDLTSPVANLQGKGTLPAIEGTPATLRGRVDLVALAKLAPNALRLRDNLTLDAGAATLRVDLSAAEGGDRVDVAASLDDFAATEAGRAIRLRRPATLTARATRSGDKVRVEAMEVKAAGVDLTAGGDLDAGVKLTGTVELDALMAQARDVLDLGGYDLSGRGRLGADYKRAGGSYQARLAADCKGLKITGLRAEPIVRDLARLDASAVGPTRPDGLPADWRRARVDVNAGDLRVDLIATARDGSAELVAGLEAAVASPVPGRFDAKATLRRSGRVVEVDDLRAGITPNDPAAASSGVVAVAVRGRLDLATGEGAFGPIPGYAVGAFGLGPDGAKVSGVGKPGAPLQVGAGLAGDLGALDRLLASWSGSPLKGMAGAWSGGVTFSRTAAGVLGLDARVDVPNIALSRLKGPVALALKGGYTPADDRLDLDALSLSTQFGRAALAGKLLEATGRRLMDLTGTVDPNWSAIDPLVAASVEPNARVRAIIRPIRLGGSLQADSTPQLLGQIGGEIGLDLSMAEAFGVTLGKAPVVLKIGAGQANFEPIRSTMNDGPVVIQGQLALDDAYGLWLRLGASRVDGAAINEAVSNSILAYVAPVLSRSSEVTGKVTATVDSGMVPITASGPMALDGAVAFQNVVFRPGPLGAELTTITGQAAPSLKLDQAMFVHVADGRVTQAGLKIPIGGNGLKVAIDGSVGFDETLDLKATIPISAKMMGLGSDPRLDKVAAGTTVSLPIGGTLARPAIDRRGLSVALRNAAKGIGEKEVKAEAGRFLDRIAGPNQKPGEPRTKPAPAAGRNPLGDLENLGREIIDPSRKP